MGRMKEFLIEQQEKGYRFLKEKYVCDKCFGDYAIKEFIKMNSTAKKCDYCQRKSKNKIAAHVGKVLEFIMKGVNTEWDDPVNCLGWSSSEGGWIGAKAYDSWDMVHEDKWELGIDNEELSQDISDAIVDREWCKIDPYGLREHERWLSLWESFSEQVKHTSRYMFFRMPEMGGVEKSDPTQPYKVLFHIGESVRELGLIKKVPIGTRYFRARTHSQSERYYNVEELGPPNKEKAKYSNRMSPAGIVMFYGSLDANTAMKEVITISKKRATHVTFAEFEVTKSFEVLDLTIFPVFPSLFDEARRHLRDPLIFLREFVADLSKPIKKDDRAHIEYVPTQVVSEYFRHVFVTEKGEHILGIIYPSSQQAGERSVVLFIDSENCTQDTISDVNDKHGKWLRLISASLKTKKIP